MVRVFMHGCCGRMGRAITEMCKNSDKYEIVAGGDVIEPEDSLGYPVFTDINKCDVDFDVIIDFSNAKAVSNIIDFAVARKKGLVLCTTGVTNEDLEKFNKASEVIPVFRSANMSLGMNVLIELVKQATKAFYPDYEIEIVEAHHNKKLDAPSGTALMIADAINEETNNELHYVYDRQSVRQARDHKELGISAIRGGNIVGDHDVMFIGDEEIVKISHTAQTRAVFARGAVTAAEYLADKKPGIYSMKNVVDGVFNK